MFDSVVIDLFNIATFFWLLFWAWFAYKNLINGYYHSILLVIIIHFLFTGIPPFLDFVIGQPIYVRRPGFHLAANDNLTSIIYCLYVSVIPPIWWWTARCKKNILLGKNFYSHLRDLIKSKKTWLHLILYIGLISPIIAWVFSPNPELYLVYAVAPLDLFNNEAELFYHRIIILTSYLSLLTSTSLFALRKGRKNFQFILFILPFIAISIWLNGKRNIIAMLLFLFICILVIKGYLKGQRLIVAIITSSLILSVFSSMYKSNIRNINVDTVGFAESYQDIRVDYGRDDVIKIAIFAELYPDELQILEYRGQTFLLWFTMYVPRSFWSNKPLPYPRHIVSAALLRPIQEWSFGITTTILSESIANFGWSGMIIGPLFISFICRAGDGTQNILIIFLTSLISCLFISLHLLPFALLFFIWTFSVILTSYKQAKIKKLRANNHF